MGWDIGKEEESANKEMKVLDLLPGRKIFFKPCIFVPFLTSVVLGLYRKFTNLSCNFFKE